MLRVLTEEEAAGRSRAMRAGAAQERALREAFMEVSEGASSLDPPSITLCSSVNDKVSLPFSEGKA